MLVSRLSAVVRERWSGSRVNPVSASRLWLPRPSRAAPRDGISGGGTAGKLTERLPLGLMLDCLQARPGSPDPRRAHAADRLRSLRQGLFADGDASVTGIEVLVGLVDELCAAAPIVLILDDLQWAGMASNTAS